MSLLPLTGSTLTTLSQTTAHRDSAEKLISSQTNPRAVLDALVSVLEINADEEEQRWSSKQRIKALVALSNFATLDSLRSDILRSFRNASSSFESLLQDKERASKEYGHKKSISTEHQLVVVLLFRCVDYRLGADDLLDLLSNDLFAALALVESLLKSTSYEMTLVIGLVRLLGEFCHPSTYFRPMDESKYDEGGGGGSGGGGGGGRGGLAEERSCVEFTARVDRLIQNLMGGTLLSTVASAVQTRISKLSRSKSKKNCDVVEVSTLMRHASVFLLNCYTFLSANPATFRQHLVVGVNLPKCVIVPFLSDVVLQTLESLGGDDEDSAAATAAAAKDDDDANNDNSVLVSSLVRSTQTCLQLLSIMYFRLNNNPAASEYILQSGHVTVQIMKQLNTVNHSKFVGLMILFHSNVDSLGPVCRSLVEDNEQWPTESAPESVFAAFEEVLMTVYKKNDVQRGRLIRMLENPEPLPIARDTETLRKLCELVERADEEEEGEEEEEVEMEEEEVEVEEVEEEEESEKKKEENEMAAAEIEGKEVEPKTKEKKKRVVVSIKPGFGSSNSTFRLLGALPEFNGHKKREEKERRKIEKKEQAKARRRKKRTQRRSAGRENGVGDGDCPPQFRCRIDGCLMKTPVRTSGGIYFEKDTIEKWLKKCGSVCPVTGEKLTRDDLTHDEGMTAAIQRYTFSKALGGQQREEAAAYESKMESSKGTEMIDDDGKGGFENDDDLYVF